METEVKIIGVLPSSLFSGVQIRRLQLLVTAAGREMKIIGVLPSSLFSGVRI